MLNNIIFHLQSAKKWDAKLFWYQFLKIIPETGFTFLTVLLPSYIVSMLQENTPVVKLLLRICIIVFGMAFCNIVSSSMEQYLYRNSLSLTLFYDQQCFQKTMRIPYHALEEKETHTLISNIWNSLRNEYIIRNSVTDFSKLLVAILASVIYGFLVLKIHLVLFTIISASIALNFALLKKSSKKQNVIYQEVGEPMKVVSYIKRHSMDRADGKDIRIYQMQDWFIQKYDTAIETLNRLYGRIHKYYFVRQLGEIGVQSITEFLSYGYLTIRLTKGEMSISAFVFSVGVIKVFSNHFSTLLQIVQGQDGIQNFLTNIRKLLSYPEENERPAKLQLDTKNGMTLELRNVSFKYENDDKYILKNMNLTIKPGEKLALIGLNGAGKTTLVKLICGFYEPTEGEIYVNGNPKKSYAQKDYIAHVSALFQDSFVFPLTLDENLTGSDDKKYDEKQLNEALHFSGFLDVYNRLDKKGDTMLVREVNEGATDFSGGEKQKLLFARALYKQAKLLILDEPTAALDPIAENQLYQNFGKAAKNNTVIFISHRLSSTRFCDRIVLLEGAKIVEEGTHEELMQKGGRYNELFAIQSKYYKNEYQREEYCNE